MQSMVFGLPNDEISGVTEEHPICGKCGFKGEGKKIGGNHCSTMRHRLGRGRRPLSREVGQKSLTDVPGNARPAPRTCVTVGHTEGPVQPSVLSHPPTTQSERQVGANLHPPPFPARRRCKCHGVRQICGRREMVRG